MPPKKKQNKNISLPVNEPTINQLPEPQIQNNNTLDKFFQIDNPELNNNDNFKDNFNLTDGNDNLNPEHNNNFNDNLNNTLNNTFNNTFNNIFNNDINANINTNINANKNDNKTEIFSNQNNVINYNTKPDNIYYSLSDIKKKIDLLTEDQQIEIFRIIKNNNEKYSVNKNGIFINISTVKKNTIKDITNLIYFSENNNKFIDAEEHNRNMYREFITC